MNSEKRMEPVIMPYPRKELTVTFGFFEEYTEENDKLRRDQQAPREKNGFFIAEDKCLDMQTNITVQDEGINEISTLKDVIPEELTKIQNLLSDKQVERQQTANRLNVTKEKLSATKTNIKETKILCKITELDRNEQQYLVSDHPKSEKVLLENAVLGMEEVIPVKEWSNKLQSRFEDNESMTFSNCYKQNSQIESRQILNTSQQRYQADSEEIEKRLKESSQLCESCNETVQEVAKQKKMLGTPLQIDSEKCSSQVGVKRHHYDDMSSQHVQKFSSIKAKHCKISRYNVSKAVETCKSPVASGYKLQEDIVSDIETTTDSINDYHNKLESIVTLSTNDINASYNQHLTLCNSDVDDLPEEDWHKCRKFTRNTLTGPSGQYRSVTVEDGTFRCLVKISGWYFGPSKYALKQRTLVGGGDGKAGEQVKKVGKSKKINLSKAFGMWSTLINKSNEKNLTKGGPYALACELLKIENLKKNRKRLQTFYFRHTHLRSELSEILPPVNNTPLVTVSSEEYATCVNKQSPDSDNKSIKSDPVSASANKSLPVHMNSPEKSIDESIKSCQSKPELDLTNNVSKLSGNEQSSYCICINDPNRWCEGGSMVECESCKQWYHNRCILKEKVNDNFFHSKSINFICGLKGCNFSEGYFFVKGAKLPTVNRADVDILFLSAPIKSKALSDDWNNFPLHSTPVTNKESLKNTIHSLKRNLNLKNNASISFDNSSPHLSPISKVNNISEEKDIHLDRHDIDTFSFPYDHKNKNLKPQIIDSVNNCSKLVEIKECEDNCSTLLNKEVGGKPEFENSNDNTNNSTSETVGNSFAENANVLNNIDIDTLDNVTAETSKNNDVTTDSLTQLNDIADYQYEYDSDENVTVNDRFSNAAISNVLGSDIPENYFTHKLNRNSFTFDIDNKVWLQLLKSRNGRYLKKNSWEHVFIKGISNSNPYCVFMFNHHSVSCAKERKRKVNTAIFSAVAKCKFVHCTCKVILKMYQETLVHVTYSGKIKHDIHEYHDRPLSGAIRSQIKTILKDGQKPLKYFLTEFNEMSSDKILAGNFGVLGKSSKKLQQVGVESRHEGRESKDLLESLMLQEKNMRKQDGGFIQKIVVSPFYYILYWNESGLRLYNDRAKDSVLYWDATGGMIRKTENNKRFLYYELAIASPVKGKMGIPITAMVSERQSLPVVLDWLREFRYGEKSLFGYSKIVQHPKMIVSDQSMVFLLAALTEFNNESIKTYLQRSYSIITGKATVPDINKTIVYVCKSHFMHNIKMYLKKKDVSLKKINFCLYLTGLLMKCGDLKELQELMFDSFIVLSSKFISEKNKPFFDRLQNKLNNFEVSISCQTDFKIEEINEKFKEINPNMFTEEEYQIMGTSSPFKNLIQHYKNISVKYIVADEKGFELNKYCCEVFMEYLCKNALPIFPFWSTILLGDLGRFNKDYASNKSNIVSTTNSLIENRFRILKHIYLNDRSQHRLDEFSASLRTHMIQIHKLSVVDCLKYKHNKKNRKRKHILENKSISSQPPTKIKKMNTLITEHWDKKKDQPDNIKDNKKSGKYQNQPKVKITFDNTTDTNQNKNKSSSDKPVTEYLNMNYNYKINIYKNTYSLPISLTDVCRFHNFGSTCWFNSVVQAFFYTKLADKVLELHFSQNCILIDADQSTLAAQSIIDVWNFMFCNTGIKVPDRILKNSLLQTCLAIPGFSQSHQQDAHEFVSYVITELGNRILDNIEICYNKLCTNCGKKSIRNENEGHSLILLIDECVSNISIQTLIDNNFMISEDINQECSECRLSSIHTVKKRIFQLPNTLVIVLRRYSHDPISGPIKLQNDIHVNEELNFSNISDQNEKYLLKSAICHKGVSSRSGHYVTVVKTANEYLCCDDEKISKILPDMLWDTGYILLYSKVNDPLPEIFGNSLTCLLYTDALSQCLNDDRFVHVPPKQKEICNSLISNGVTPEILNVFENDLSSLLKDTSDTSISGVFSILNEYLFSNSCRSAKSLRKEYFEINFIGLKGCKNCCDLYIKEVSIQNVISSTSHDIGKNLYAEAFKKFVNLNEKTSMSKCKCKIGSSVEGGLLFLSLPHVLILVTEDTSKFVIKETIDIKNSIEICYPLNCTEFKLRSIACGKIGKHYSLIRKGQVFVEAQSQKEYDLDFIRRCDYASLFYQKCACSLDLRSINFLTRKRLENARLPEIPLCSNYSPEKSIYGRKVCGVKLTKNFYSSLTDKDTWLSSDHINIYLNAIAKKSPRKIHIVDSVWFASTLFKNSNLQQLNWLINVTESKVIWFDKDIIVIPINEDNSHWTLAIVLIKEKTIIYSNSYGTNVNTKFVCFQLWRYLCYEALINASLCLESSEWSLVLYSLDGNFPVQTDTSSCGVYVCAVSYAIIFQYSMPTEPNLAKFRIHMANEISKFK